MVDFHSEFLAMIRTALALYNIDGLSALVRLQILLQGGLMVSNRPPLQQFSLQFSNVWPNGVALHEGTGCFQSGIKIKRCDNRFHTVGQQGAFFSAAAPLFAFAHAHVSAETNSGPNLPEMFSANERGAQSRQFSLA